MSHRHHLFSRIITGAVPASGALCLRLQTTTKDSWQKILATSALGGALACGMVTDAVAQTDSSSTTLRPVTRDYGGWQSGRAGAAAGQNSNDRRAYFQTSGLPMQPTSFPNAAALAEAQPGFGGAALPTPPGSMPNTLRDNGGSVQPAGGMPAYDPFANPGGQLPPTDVRQASGTGLRDAQVAHQPNMPNANMPYANNPAAPGYQPAMFQQTAPNMNTNPGVYPPGAYAQQGYAQPGYAQPGYAQQGNGQQVYPPTNLRNAAVATNGQQQPQPRMTTANIPVVSQDPRFISPPPRTGNYATSPYISPYRTVSYQLPQPAVMPQVQQPTGLPNQPATVASSSSLPQFQPTVGVYPTAYQTGYQAGYQYCAPGIPAGGVPQVVPGAVVPPTLPPNMAPQLYSPDNSGYKPLFSLGQENYNVQLGRGIIGQPTAYVPGQPVRNFLRYLSP